MSEPGDSPASSAPPDPWNKGKLIGQMPPLQPKHVWSIRTRLQLDGRLRDLALFNLAMDSKLRACDLVRLRIEDVAPHGTPPNEPRSNKGRQVDQSGSKSQSKAGIEQLIGRAGQQHRSEEHTSELQSLMRISYS